jgi:hypothetical protein
MAVYPRRNKNGEITSWQFHFYQDRKPIRKAGFFTREQATEAMKEYRTSGLRIARCPYCGGQGTVKKERNENMDKVSIEMITPRRAEELLKTLDERQRPLFEGRVIEYADDMLKDLWLVTGDAIIIHRGRLVNGQHRLRAVILANKPQRFLILETDKDLSLVTDKARSRTMGWYFQHYLEFPTGNLAAAVTQRILLYDRMIEDDRKAWPTGIYVSPKKMELFAVKNHEELHEVCEVVSRLYSCSRMVPPSVSGAALFIGRRANHSQMEGFLNSVLAGTGLQMGTPAYLVNRRLVRSFEQREKLSATDKFHLLLKGFNLHLAGATLKYIVFDTKEFPRIIAQETTSGE